MSYENLLYEKKDGIGHITFNRPKVLNALNRQTIEELHKILLDARGDSSCQRQIPPRRANIRLRNPEHC